MSIRFSLLLCTILLIFTGCGSSGGSAETPTGLAPMSAEEIKAQEDYAKEYAAKDPKDR